MTNLDAATTIDELNNIVILTVVSFALSMLATPIYTTLVYKHKWYKKPRSESGFGGKAKVFNKLHKDKFTGEGLPTMAGIIFLVVTAIITLGFNLSRSQTYLPLAAMLGAGVIGLIDDLINVRGLGGVAGIKKGTKLALTTLVGLSCGWYFYYKLGSNDIYLPYFGDVVVGWLIIPVFVFIVVACANAVNIADGLDGLSGGLSTSAFSAYGVIALLQGNYGISGFCFTIVGILMSYTWFNIYPARFMMGDTGSLALGTALGVIAMLTNTVTLLPVIGFVFVVEVASVILQVASKKIRGKKLFKIAPIHHHFEAIGWPEAKVTMRFWLIGQVFSGVGLALAIIGGYV